MYEAPDKYKRMVSARLPDGESLAFSSGGGQVENSPLRDAQLLARAELAPFFAAANIAAAAIIITCLWNEVSIVWTAGWGGAVALVNLVTMQMARNQAITHVGRSGQRLRDWLVAGFVISFVAGLATGPFAIQHFNRVTLWGLPANLATEALSSLVVVANAARLSRRSLLRTTA